MERITYSTCFYVKKNEDVTSFMNMFENWL